MRYLAIARYRLLTTLRVATPVFVAGILPPLLGAIVQSEPEPTFRSEAALHLGINAAASLFAWYFHIFILAAAADAFGSRGLFRTDLTALPSDLMDSVPVGPRARFWGETVGNFAATAAIHACCLPLLAVVAVLSPLPTRIFVWIEIVGLVLMFLAGAGAAWKRLAPRTKFAATRAARSAILFWILFLCALFATTRWDPFRDALFGFLEVPSTQAAVRIISYIDNPFALLFLVAILYFGYLAFYYIYGTRDPAQA